MNATSQPFLLAIAGPTGSGKSTLSRLIAERSCGGLVPEPILEENLRAFENAPQEHCWRLQLGILEAKNEYFRRVAHNKIIILDRTVAEDRQIFLEMHHSLGLLDKTHLAMLRRISYKVGYAIGKPNATLLITAKMDTLKSRMIADGRPPWLVASLPEQLRLYERYFASIHTRRVNVDSSRLTLDDLHYLADWTVSTMVPAVGTKDQSFDSKFGDLFWKDSRVGPRNTLTYGCKNKA